MAQLRTLSPGRSADARPATGGVRLGILGTLEARSGQRRIALGPFKQRVVLALLLCYANRVVSADALSEALWGDEPPRSGAKGLQVYVSNLRKLLAEEPGIPIEHACPGYVIDIGPDRLDSLGFHRLTRAGREAARAGDAAAACEVLGGALSLWRGPILHELRSVPALASEADRLQGHYLDAYEDWAEAMLATGRHLDMLEGIARLARRHPFRERLRHAQMVALRRAGRLTEALAAFDGLRQELSRELGLAPSPVLTRLYEAILSGEPDADAPVAVGSMPVGAAASAGAVHGAAVADLSQDAASFSGLPCELLSRDLADFTGRADGVRRLSAVLDGRGGVTVVSGPAGVGKTALAVHCAHLFAARYPEGRILIPLRDADGRPRSGTDVRAVVGRVVGTGADHELLLAATSGRRMLVILDDAVDEAQIRPVLTTLGLPCEVVVTARRHLAGLEGAAHVAVPPMAETEALRLLSRLVGEARVAADPVAARRLVTAAGRLPLAVRIIGAKLAGLGHLSLARYADRLADPDRVLDELAAGDLAIRARLAGAWADLGEHERRALKHLAAAPDRPLSAIEAAHELGLAPVRAEILLEQLFQAHVLETEPAEAEEDDETEFDVVAHAIDESSPRYRVPSIIRAFVREQPPR